MVAVLRFLSTKENYGTGVACCRLYIPDESHGITTPNEQTRLAVPGMDISQRRTREGIYGTVVGLLRHDPVDESVRVPILVEQTTQDIPDLEISQRRLRDVFKCIICLSRIRMPAYACIYSEGCGRLIGCRNCVRDITECPMCRVTWPTSRSPVRFPGLDEFIGTNEADDTSSLSSFTDGSIGPMFRRDDVRNLFKCNICAQQMRMPVQVCGYDGGCGRLIGCSTCCNNQARCPLCRRFWPDVRQRKPLLIPGLDEVLSSEFET
ncbi:uncharacterized protein LOC144432901 [Glandiceps talaboti]